MEIKKRRYFFDSGELEYLAETLRKKRIEKGFYSADALANRSGVSRQAIYKIENKQNKTGINIYTLDVLAEALECDPQSLWDSEYFDRESWEKEAKKFERIYRQNQDASLRKIIDLIGGDVSRRWIFVPDEESGKNIYESCYFINRESQNQLHPLKLDAKFYIESSDIDRISIELKKYLEMLLLYYGKTTPPGVLCNNSRNENEKLTDYELEHFKNISKEEAGIIEND